MAILIGVLIIGIEALLVHTGPRLDICRDYGFNGFGGYLLATLAMLGGLLIPGGFINPISRVRSPWLVGILSILLLIGTGVIAICVALLLDIRDCGQMSF